MLGNLAIVLGLAAVGGVVAKMLRQPVMVGYIVVGVILSQLIKMDLSLINSLGQLGITLLLFLVGLELPLTALRKIGHTAVVTGIGQIVITTILGFVLARLMGFANSPAFYVGLALTFGSTVLVIKLLSEKRDLTSLYGKIAVGFLLVQDFVAIMVLVILSGGQNLGYVMFKTVLLVCIAAILSIQVLPRVLGWIGKSSEVLFVVSLSWCLGVAAIANKLGLSMEIGGFLAGLALASTAQNLQIVSRIRPLRDFFVTLFFISLGAGLNLTDIGYLLWPAILLSLFVLIGNPLIVMWILGLLGYHKRIGFMAGTTVAQVSEFSLVLLALAHQKGLVSGEVVSLVALVAVITLTLSTYLITYADQVYRQIAHFLWVYPLKKSNELKTDSQMTGHIVMFGHNRTGSAVLPQLQKMGNPILVVDFDPEVVEQLHQSQIEAVCGDMGDYELYEHLQLPQAKAIISTVSDVSDNLQLLTFLQDLKNRPLTIVVAADSDDAAYLYQKGADYVLVPYNVGGEYLARILEVRGLTREPWQKIK